MSQSAQCCICSQILGERDGDLISRFLGEENYVRRVVSDGNFFTAIPSLGPIMEGHVLVCPKEHVRSIGELFRRHLNDAISVENELGAILDRMTGALTSLFDAPIHRFEHGSATRGHRIVCTVEHAHLHLLPARVDVTATLLGDRRWRRIDPELTCLANLTNGDEYLYYASPSGSAFLATGAGGFPSQYLRRVFWSALGQPCEWDWRKEPRAELADKLFQSLSCRFLNYLA